MSRENIHVRAGKRAYDLIRAGGFSLDRISTYFGPAGGPRWLVASGFDLALLREGLLGRRQPVWLVGASAGAWRFAAWLQPEAEKSYRALMEAYIGATYGRNDTPATILQTLTAIVDRYIDDDALSFALTCKPYRLAISRPSVTWRRMIMALFEALSLSGCSDVTLTVISSVSNSCFTSAASLFFLKVTLNGLIG